MRIVHTVLTVFLLSLVVTSVHADGTHGVKVTVINKSGGKIEIMTYNSKDHSLTVPHKVYYADAGGTRTAKAHGQGNHNLKMTVRRPGSGLKCYSSDGKNLIAHDNKWPDGATVTVGRCETEEERTGNTW